MSDNIDPMTDPTRAAQYQRDLQAMMTQARDNDRAEREQKFKEAIERKNQSNTTTIGQNGFAGGIVNA